MSVWHIFADEGGLIVERHGGYWEFIPNGKVGRPRKVKEPPKQPKKLSDILPSNIIIESWKLSDKI